MQAELRLEDKERCAPPAPPQPLPQLRLAAALAGKALAQQLAERAAIKTGKAGRAPAKPAGP